MPTDELNQTDQTNDVTDAPEPGPLDFLTPEQKTAYFTRGPGHDEAVALVHQRLLLAEHDEDQAKRQAEGFPEENAAILEQLPDLPAGKSWDVGLAAEVLNCAAVEGIPETDLKEGLKYFAEHGSGEIPTAEVAEQTLRSIWKSDYETKLASARDAIRPYPQLAAILERTGLGNSPPLLQWLAERGASRAGIQSEIDRLSATPEYRNGGPGHDEMVERVRILYKKLYA